MDTAGGMPQQIALNPIATEEDETWRWVSWHAISDDAQLSPEEAVARFTS